MLPELYDFPAFGTPQPTRFRVALLVLLDLLRPPFGAIVGLRTRADIVFTKQHIAIYLDECFWHGCPDHGSTPTANADYWLPKLDRNRARDRDVTRRLQDADWTVLRFWEHEPVDSIIETIMKTLDDQRVPREPGQRRIETL